MASNVMRLALLALLLASCLADTSLPAAAQQQQQQQQQDGGAPAAVPVTPTTADTTPAVEQDKPVLAAVPAAPVPEDVEPALEADMSSFEEDTFEEQDMLADNAIAAADADADADAAAVVGVTTAAVARVPDAKAAAGAGSAALLQRLLGAAIAERLLSRAPAAAAKAAKRVDVPRRASAQLAPGDIVSVALDLPITLPPTESLYVINGETLETRFSSNLLLTECGAAAAASVALSADATQVVIVCQVDGVTPAPGKAVFADFTDPSNPVVTGSVDIPAGFNPWNAVYRRSGALLVGASRKVDVNCDQSAQVCEYDNAVFQLSTGASPALLGNYTLESGGNVTTIALAAKGNPLVYTDWTPEVLAFDIKRNVQGPTYATIPGAKYCTAAAPLFDGSVLVGCVAQTGDVCAYRVRDCGRKRKSGGVSRVVAQWCAPHEATPLNSSLPMIALDIDREHFFFAIFSASLAETGATDVPDLYKISVADFVPVANATINAALLFPVVYKAVPANFQDCPVGFGQCCSAAGQMLLAGTTCTATQDPCSLSSTCDGMRTTCPKRWAKNGTPCTLDPPSLLEHPYHGMGRAMGHHEGHNKTARCFKGFCGKRAYKQNKAAGHYKRHGSKHAAEGTF